MVLCRGMLAGACEQLLHKEEEEDKVWKVLQDRLEEFLKENDQTSDKATKAPSAHRAQ